MSIFNKLVARIVVLAMLASPFQIASAAMIGSEQVANAVQLQSERDRVVSFLSRENVASELTKMGVAADSARDRVAAMTDAEVRTLANHIDSMPAGADSTAGWVAFIVIVGLILWYAYR